MRFWIYGLFSVAFFALLNDFVALWLGRAYVLHWTVLIAIVVNFYLYGMMSAIGVFRSTTGLFRQTRYVFLVTAALNLLLSYLFGLQWGLPGILYATCTARLLTQVWFEPVMLFRLYFHAKSWSYFLKQAIYASLVAFSCVILVLGARPFAYSTIAHLGVSLVLVLVIPNLLFFVTLRRTAAFQVLTSRFGDMRKQFTGR